ncbi:MAG: hypothetical protein KAS17_01090, partial [Victivallaceae bacterium]|nr:hypothetical protein [Victivallaceae bacterium]
ALVVIFSGCSTPQVSSHGIVDIDSEVIEGGIGSNEVRTVAQKMCPAILSLPDIANSNSVTRIAISPMKNSSRFIVNTNIFMKKLRLDLNRYSKGKIRFFSQNNARKTRHRILKNRRENHVEASLNDIAKQFVQSYIVTSSKKQLRLATIPVLSTNLVGMNADSMIATLRSKIAGKSKGKVVFTMPGTVNKADYLLTGQFIADSIKKEGIVNLVDYIKVMNKRIKEGKSLEVYERTAATKNSGVQINLVNKEIFLHKPELFRQIQASANLRAEPNVTKKLNLLVVNAKDKLVVFEKLFVIEKKITDGTAKSNLILSGEITSMTKKQSGKIADYLLITMQLIAPESNEVLWEDGYEVKKASVTGIVYQ